MLHCHLRLSSPAEYLAADEVLLDQCEAGTTGEVLCFWTPPTCFVVVGYANQVAAEVNLTFCENRGIPILRRCTGGGAVLQGPGCLNYSLLLTLDHDPVLQTISGTNSWIMQRHAALAATVLGSSVSREGHTDLVIGGRKFSGNAQRRRRKSLLFHGSFLLDLDLGLIEQAPLAAATRKEKPYRGTKRLDTLLRSCAVERSRLLEEVFEEYLAAGGA